MHNMPPLEQLLPEHFEPLLGRRLPLEAGGVTRECELTEVRRLPAHALNAHPFALTLRGPRNQPFGQGTHGLLHPELGRLELFVVPIGPDRVGLCYEITFN